MKHKIPKIIHYCWFGNNKMPDELEKYINGWKKKCPDYTFIKWSEENFDVSKFNFTYKAYNKKNWAAVSDYVRLYVLNDMGGVYLDTDVELLKPIDNLLNNQSFIGAEDFAKINSGLIYGSCKNDINVFNMLIKYNQIGNDNHFNKFMNNQVQITTSYFRNLGFKYYSPKKQVINGCVIYPTCYFCPQRYGYKKIKITDKTYAFHHYYGSWTNKMSIKKRCHIIEGNIVKRIITPDIFNYLYNKYKSMK